MAVGGSGRVLGPLVGTLVVRFGQQALSSNFGLEESWQLFMGLALILVVLVAPGGLLGISLRGRLRRASSGSTPPTPPVDPLEGKGSG